ncbi:MAG: exo-beta-N-acetylmuramidase NamZ family protein [bacterium]
MGKVGPVVIPFDRVFDVLEGKNVGLITNHTGVTQNLKHIADVLNERGINIVALFGPEHGIRGEAQAGEAVESYIDEKTGAPVHSLYGPVKKPTPDMLKGANILVFYIQDVGSRFYTYISTMAYCMEAASEVGIPFVVIDRPAPLGGIAVEGNVSEEGYRSFVAVHPLPVRYGMTVGELARMFNGEYGIGVELEVIAMEGWRREMWYDETDLPWVYPSPNIPTLDSAIAFPCTNLLSRTNLSVGRGTTKPFELLGAPWIDPFGLADELNELGRPGVLFRPAYFVPTFSTWEGERCGGIQLHVMDRDAFLPAETGICILTKIRDLYPGKFQLRGSDFDRAMGTASIRAAIEGGLPAEEIIAKWEEGLKAFKGIRNRYLVY